MDLQSCGGKSDASDAADCWQEWVRDVLHLRELQLLDGCWGVVFGARDQRVCIDVPMVSFSLLVLILKQCIVGENGRAVRYGRLLGD